MERRLYESCVENNITCITISHRPVLEQYHDVVLNVLKDGKGGWDFRMTDRGRLRRARGELVLDEKMIQVADDVSKKSKVVSMKSPDVIGAGYDEVGGVSAAYLADMGGTSAEQGELERKHLKDRSKMYRAAAEAEAAEAEAGGKTSSSSSATDLLNDLGNGGKRDVPMWTRFWDVWNRGFMPRGMSMKDPEARRILLLGVMVVGKTVAADWIAFYDGYILTTVLQSKWSTFLRAITIGAVMRSSLALFDAGMTRQKWYLNLAWRKRLTKYLMDKYFHHNTFYDVKNQDDRITDPEERLTEQVEQLSVSLTELWSDLLRPAFDITFNFIMLSRVMGSKAIGGMAGYMCVAAGLLQFIVPNFRQQVRKQFKLEGRFRFVHTRLVNHTESVAFFGGDEVEKEVCDGRLNELSKHVALTLKDSLRFNVFNNFMVRQTPDLAAFSLRMYFAMSMSTAVGSTIASTGEYIQQTVMRTFKSFGDAFELQETIGNFIGTLENVSDLMYTLEDLSDKQTARQGKGSNSRLGRSEDGSINFQNVDIVAPGKRVAFFLFFFLIFPRVVGRRGSHFVLFLLFLLLLSLLCFFSCSSLPLHLLFFSFFSFFFFFFSFSSLEGGTCCASDLTFKVKRGEPLIVTGPNASGKSSLFRMLGGLWKVPAGKIERPCDEKTEQITSKDIFLVPQKPYSVRGTLADQITYPKKINAKKRTPMDEEALFHQLTMVEIEYLVDRYAEKNEEGKVIKSGWDAVMKWEDVLSLGEQQRIGCARLFYTNPDFAILDECTSAVSVDVEEKLYRQAHAQSITSITISQRLALEEFHSQELKLGDANGAKGWSLRSI